MGRGDVVRCGAVRCGAVRCRVGRGAGHDGRQAQMFLHTYVCATHGHTHVYVHSWRLQRNLSLFAYACAHALVCVHVHARACACVHAHMRVHMRCIGTWPITSPESNGVRQCMDMSYRHLYRHAVQTCKRHLATIDWVQ